VIELFERLKPRLREAGAAERAQRKAEAEARRREYERVSGGGPGGR
jgi:hypothetical protein